VEVEGGADPDQDRRVQPVAVLGHPAVLLGGTETDPDEVRACRVDPVDDRRILGLAQGPVRR
jgi:hypothetical protein